MRPLFSLRVSRYIHDADDRTLIVLRISRPRFHYIPTSPNTNNKFKDPGAGRRSRALDPATRDTASTSRSSAANVIDVARRADVVLHLSRVLWHSIIVLPLQVRLKDIQGVGDDVTHYMIVMYMTKLMMCALKRM